MYIASKNSLTSAEFIDLLGSPLFCQPVAHAIGHTALVQNESGLSVHKGSYGIQVSEPVL